MASVLRYDAIKSPLLFTGGGFIVYAANKPMFLSEFQDSNSRQTVDVITDVCCSYCGLPVLWEASPSSTLIIDIKIYSQLHNCKKRFNEFGICNPGILSQSVLTTIFQDYVSLGAIWVRTDVNWARVQMTTANTFNFSFYDTFVQTALNNGLKVSLILDYSNTNFNGGLGDKYPPTNPSTFANYVTATVSHYFAMGVTTFEVWNEPNINTFWQPAPDPVVYTAILKAAYTAAKAISSTVNVVAGSLTLTSVNEITASHYSAPNFIDVMYQQGAKGYFDALNYHPYDWKQSTIDAIRKLMVDNGDGHKKIWLTEYGKPTGGAKGQSFTNELEQANLIAVAVAKTRSLPYAGPLMIYQYRDSQAANNPIPDTEGYFGLLRNDYTQKPSYTAFKTAIADKTIPAV